jgi:hypothetical protein
MVKETRSENSRANAAAAQAASRNRERLEGRQAMKLQFEISDEAFCDLKKTLQISPEQFRNYLKHPENKSECSELVIRILQARLDLGLSNEISQCCHDYKDNLTSGS